MKGKCSLSGCGLKQGLSCELGHIEPEKCPHFQTVGDELAGQSVEVVTSNGVGQRLPWTGRALGLNDIMLVSARSACSLVGLIGPFNAGKTTFLASLFANLGKTGELHNHSFAGSFTIDAWARLKQYTEWPADNGPTFPPHTPDTGDRVPSLLHLAFRQEGKNIHDVLFTEAPGEWFTRWLRNQSAESAAGARWISDHATHFLFFVDRDDLAGPNVGKARQETLALARLLAENKNGRPIYTVWSKSDMPHNDAIEKPIREKLAYYFGPDKSWNIQAEDNTCIKITAEILSRIESSLALRYSTIPTKTNSAFLAFSTGGV